MQEVGGTDEEAYQAAVRWLEDAGHDADRLDDLTAGR
jgi:hypothetical protein